MSRDIRSFFTTISKKTVAPPTQSNEKTTSKKRPKSNDSSIDDIIPGTPSSTKKNKKSKRENEVKRRRIQVLSDSDSDQEKKEKKSRISKKDKKETNENKTSTKVSVDVKEKPKIALRKETKKEITDTKPKKVVNPFEVFGNEPVKQSQVEKKNKNSTEFEIHDDEDFEKTLLELDEEQFISTTEKSIDKNDGKFSSGSETETVKKAAAQKSVDILQISSEKESEKKKTTNKKENATSRTTKSDTEKFTSGSDSENKKKTPQKTKNIFASTPKAHDNHKIMKTPSAKRKVSESDDSCMDPDQEKYEKKRHSAMLYQKYLNRSGPAHPGSKWIPKGKDDCLKGISFVVTGIFDSLTRDEANNLVVEHGGRCVTSVSKKVNYMVLGEEAGPAKVEKGIKFGIKTLTEDDLIDLICTKSGIKNKNTSNKTENEIESKNKSASPKKRKAEMVSVKHENDVDSDPKKETIKNNKLDFSAIKKIKTEAAVMAKDEDAFEIPPTTVKKESNIKVNKLYKQKTEEQSTSKKKLSPKKEKIVKDQLSWVDKYKPTELKQIIGQQGDNSNAKKLMSWLRNWYKNHNGKTKLTKPSPWAKNDDGAYFKAALLSGPPGVGKTTTATVVCQELGFDTVEFNASNTRNKKMIHEEISQLLKTKTLAGYFTDGSAPTNKHVLLMDEVDGMSGNEDRGGMQELITLIKNSNIPIVCMCNDRQHPKIRSLSSYCFDLRYGKPRLEQVRGAMMSICYKENIDISAEALNEVILGSGMDVRQTLNHLSMWSAKGQSLSNETAKKEAKVAQKDTKLGSWEVIRKVFSEEEHKTMSFEDKYGLFFYDYSINPLFVQENYLQVMPHCPKEDVLKRVAYAADSISLGDLVDSKIRSNQSWGLLDTQALYSSVIPGECMEGHMAGQINFPGWLGKNSKRNKFQRMLSELQGHMRTSISGSRTAVNLDYLSYIRDAIVTPLAKDGVDGIPRALAVMQEYHLLREDLTNIAELAHWPKTKDVFSSIDSKVKAAFTRAYNKDSGMLPYAIAAAPVRKKRAAGSQEDEELENEDNEDESSAEENDNIDNDAMIKAKKPGVKTGKAESKCKTSSKGKESKGRAPSKPRSKRGK